nr:hypothetical protein [Tanacetum cinerariifolium]
CASNVFEPELRTIVEIAPMADNRTMEELLQALTEGYGEAIAIPEINADHLKLRRICYNCAIFMAVASLFFWQWQLSSLAVGTSSASGNSIPGSGIPCAFYSQQSSPKLDALAAIKPLILLTLRRSAAHKGVTEYDYELSDRIHSIFFDVECLTFRLEYEHVFMNSTPLE